MKLSLSAWPQSRKPGQALCGYVIFEETRAACDNGIYPAVDAAGFKPIHVIRVRTSSSLGYRHYSHQPLANIGCIQRGPAPPPKLLSPK